MSWLEICSKGAWKGVTTLSRALNQTVGTDRQIHDRHYQLPNQYCMRCVRAKRPCNLLKRDGYNSPPRSRHTEPVITRFSENDDAIVGAKFSSTGLVGIRVVRNPPSRFRTRRRPLRLAAFRAAHDLGLLRSLAVLRRPYRRRCVM
jgi:hypothetical protein